MYPALAPPIDAGVSTAVDTPSNILPIAALSSLPADFTLRSSTICVQPDGTSLNIPLHAVDAPTTATKRQVRDIEAQTLPEDPSPGTSES